MAAMGVEAAKAHGPAPEPGKLMITEPGEDWMEFLEEDQHLVDQRIHNIMNQSNIPEGSSLLEIGNVLLACLFCSVPARLMMPKWVTVNFAHSLSSISKQHP